MNIFERIACKILPNRMWRLLPDRCYYRKHRICSRKNVRGNENIIYHPDLHQHIMVCDDCHVYLGNIYGKRNL